MRINIVGTSGSGKSTFARQLAQNLKLPYIEMDKLFWRPNWQEASREEFFADLKEALARHDGWVLDGNYSRTVPIKWQQADTVIWLDYSFGKTLYRAFTRAVGRIIDRTELWEGTGNRESFRLTFLSRKSILWWTITTHASVRRMYEAAIDDPQYSHIRFIRVRSQREANALPKSL